MAILVSCAGCGKQFRAKDQFKNTKLKCPNCKADVVVSGPHVCGSDVFISHSTNDKQVADAVCAAMESKNLRCWIAPRDIPAGASWGASIVEGIEDSRAMLLVFSQHANRSDQVLREVERAVAKKKTIVPLRIDREPMRKDYEYFLASCHWLDATDGALEDHLAGLTRRVRQLLLERAEDDADHNSPPPAQVAAQATAAGPSQPMPTSALTPDVRQEMARRKKTGLIVAVVLVLAVIGIGIAIAMSRRHDSGTNAIAPTTVPTTTTTHAHAAGAIDLLARLKLPDDIVSGQWTRQPDGSVHVAGPAPGRCNFGDPPAGDYDLRIEFTPLIGDDGVGIILSRFGQNFAFGMGQKVPPGYGFGYEKGKFARRSMINKNIGPLANDTRHTAIIKVRRHEAIAFLDGQRVASIRTNDFSELSVPRPWSVGRNAIGISTFRSLIVHAVECTRVVEDSP
jgi:hypothetical protein